MSRSAIAGKVGSTLSKNPKDSAYWTPARRKKHSERLEAFYDLQLQTPGWEAYIAVTSGRWGRDARKAQSKRMRQYWASITPEERLRRGEAVSEALSTKSRPYKRAMGMVKS